MATGITKRHSKLCGSRRGGGCDCKVTYQAWIYLERDGRKLYKTFDRMAGAKAWRADALVESKRGALRLGRDPRTIAVALTKFVDGMKEGTIRPRGRERYKPATIRGYDQQVRRHIAPSPLGSLKVTDVRRRDVQDFADELLVAGLCSSSVSNALNPLQVFYRRAMDREEVAHNPTSRIDLPKHNPRIPRVASPGEIEDLLDALQPADRPIWATAFYAGLRRGELQALRCSDIDAMAYVIHVRSGWDQYEGRISPKSEAGVREVPLLTKLEPFLIDHLLRTGHRGDDLLFGRTAAEPFYASTLAYRATKRWEEVGLSRLTLHECRHTFVSLSIDVPSNSRKTVQSVAGHSKMETTLDTYTHMLPGAIEKMRLMMNAHLENGPSGESHLGLSTGAQASDDWCASGAPPESGDFKDPFIQHFETPAIRIGEPDQQKTPRRGGGALLGLLQGGEI
jgi:integrase